MKVSFVLYNFDPEYREPEQFYTNLQENLLSGIDPLGWGIDRINLVCRAGLNADYHTKDISIYLRQDEFRPYLSWHQRPDPIFSLLNELKPDIIHAFSLGLPLHFRWLRKMLGPHVCLVAQHTGESHWIQLKLWLQQFGLRTVDGFVFGHIEDAQPWLKAALILPAQRVISLENGNALIRRDRIIPDLYKELFAPDSF